MPVAWVMGGVGQIDSCKAQRAPGPWSVLGVGATERSRCCELCSCCSQWELVSFSSASEVTERALEAPVSTESLGDPG